MCFLFLLILSGVSLVLNVAVAPGHSENCLYNRPAYKRTFHFRERKNENVILLLSAGQVGSVKFRTPGRHHTEIKAQGTQEGIFDPPSHS